MLSHLAGLADGEAKTLCVLSKLHPVVEFAGSVWSGLVELQQLSWLAAVGANRHVPSFPTELSNETGGSVTWMNKAIVTRNEASRSGQSERNPLPFPVP